jgi:hypothetical protein
MSAERPRKDFSMKKFSLVALLLCAAMIGCKDDGKGGATGSAAKSTASPSATPTTTAPPATAPVGS